MSRVLRVLAFAPLLVVSAFAQYPGSQPPPKDFAPGFNRITLADAKKHLEYLAGPECQGRGTGQPGYQKAAEYVAARFKEYGLKPASKDGTYFQMVPFYEVGFDVAASSLKIGETKLIPNQDWTVTRAGAGRSGAGKVVELTLSSDDFSLAGLDLEGAIVLVRYDKPRDNRTNFRIRTTINEAKAASVLFVTPAIAVTSGSISRTQPRAATTPTMALGSITEAAAERLLAAATAADTAVSGDKAPSKVRIGTTPAEFAITMATKQINVPNVVAKVEGTDPTLKAEVVGLGAHLDHLGVVGGEVYWGADDDGSGSTALIEVAKAVAQNPKKPRRTVLFMAFCGEEMGLIGSAYYAENPVYPHDSMVALLQMDMVGRDSDGIQNGDRNRVDKASENVDTMRLVGSKRISTELDAMIQSLNAHTNFKFKYDAEDVYTRSDHYNFAKNGVPIAFFFDGFHPDYHQKTDTVEKINFMKLTTTARLVYLTAMRLATQDGRPKKDVTGQ